MMSRPVTPWRSAITDDSFRWGFEQLFHALLFGGAG
jgi:hypothetical protein